MTRAGNATIEDQPRSEVRKLGGIAPANRADPQTFVNLATALLNDISTPAPLLVDAETTSGLCDVSRSTWWSLHAAGRCQFVWVAAPCGWPLSWPSGRTPGAHRETAWKR